MKKERREKIRKKTKEVKENIKNVPNFLTLLRAILSIVIIILVILGHPLSTIIVVFIIAALTDAADGYIARKYHQVTNFGRKFDPIVDRILTISIFITLIIYMFLRGTFTQRILALILMILTREILSAPFFISSIFLKNVRRVPHARWVGKITTAMQGVTFPFIVFNWYLTPILAVLTSIIGSISAGFFVYDSIINPHNKTQVKLDKYYKALANQVK